MIIVFGSYIDKMQAAHIARLRRHLDRLVERTDVGARRAADPVGLVRRFDSPEDREIAGLVAALLAFGRVEGIRRSVGRVFDRLGPSPAAVVRHATDRELIRRLDGIVHRIYRGEDLARVLAGARDLLVAHGSLEEAMAVRLRAADGEFRSALASFADALRGSAPARCLVPDPNAGSACKRLLLYLRWMVRPDDGVDLGVWTLPTSILLVPLDTHVHRIARNLDLTARGAPSWRAAEEVTARLRELNPEDPVRYDFALCHHGVTRSCPSRAEASACAQCVLQPICAHWSAVERVQLGRQSAASLASNS